MSHKHGKKREFNYIPAAAITLGVFGAGVCMTGTASAASATVWDRLAQCEASGNFSTDTGNGYYGGFQFSQQTWNEVGGTGNPANATPAEQLKRAKIALSTWGASSQWPVCSGVAGLTQSNGAAEGLSGVSGTPTPPSPTVPPAATGSNSPAVGSKAYIAIQYAKSKISSAQYLWGGEGPVRFDCSGLTSQAWEAAGVHLLSIARDSYGQEAGGWAGSSHPGLANIRPGDLVAYNGFSGGHVALYVGPIGPNGENLIETNSRHPGSGVNWSFMDSRSGRSTSLITGITRPAPFVGASTPTTPPPTTPPPTTPPPSTGGKYTVVSGDSLSGIATKKAVTGGWQALYAANKAVVGPNPNLIFPGQKLTLPGGVVTPPSTPPPVTPPPASSGWVKPLTSYTKGDGLIIGAGGSMSRSAGGHSGQDLIAPSGTPIKSVTGGTVVGGNAGSAYGNHVIVKGNDGKYTLYAHMSAKSSLGAAGSTVKAGDVIGYVGSTGNSTGPHLHFEVRTDPTAFNSSIFIDPTQYMASHGVTL